MSDPSSDADDSDDALPVPARPEPTESEATKPDVGHETSLTAISISQITRQVQLFVPSMIQVIGDVADRHPDIAHKIVDDIIDKGQHRQEIERVVVRGNDRRADRGQLLAWIFAVLALFCGFVLIMTDRSSYGIAVIVTAVAPLVGVNLIGRYVAQRERRRKMTLPVIQDVDEEPPEPDEGD